jgi:uncharacterized protein
MKMKNYIKSYKLLLEEEKEKVENLNQAFGLLRRSFTKHKNNKVAFGDTADRGLGVFAATSIRDGELIEICPYIKVGKKALSITNLQDYIFTVDPDTDEYACVLGYGGLYNHSDDPNADWHVTPETNEIRIVAVGDIADGEEITVSYGDKYWESRDINKK